LESHNALKKTRTFKTQTPHKKAFFEKAIGLEFQNFGSDVGAFSRLIEI